MKLYLILGAVIAMLGAITGAGIFGYSAGKNSERAAQAVIIEEAREEERAKVKTVIEYRDKIKVVYNDRIKEVRLAKDPSGCLDVKYTDMGVGLYQDR